MQIKNICAQDWHFHTRTGTCFRVFKSSFNFNSARTACQQQKWGPDQRYPGWLAGIHDVNTDAFVRKLLNQDQKAYIGLYKSNGYFYWIDGTSYSSTYNAWVVGEPYYDYAYMTKASWETTGASSRLDFVCQTYAMFPSPSLNCEPMRIGAAFSPLTCQIDVYESFQSFKEFVMGNSRYERLINCLDDYKCYKSSEFVSAVLTNDRRMRSISTTVTVDRRVNRSDDRISWNCEYQFTNTPKGFLTTSCEIQVYNVPSGLKCQHTLNDTLVILCEAEGVYPQADSNLMHYINGNLMGKWSWSNAEHIKYFENNLLFYRSKFEKRVADQMNQGQHKIEISVFPNAPFYSQKKRKEASELYSIEFVISAPPASPVFSSGNGLKIVRDKLTAREGQDVYLICNVDGGNPPVFETKIVCGDGIGDPRKRRNWISQKQKAEAKFAVSRAMTQKACTCTAKHVSRQYTQQSSVLLDIQYPVEISSFAFNSHQDEEIELNEGEQVNLLCSAQGNPKPHLHIFHLVNDGESSKYLANKSHSQQLSVNINLSSSMSGIYICSARNNITTEVQIRRVHLMVRCPPRPCSQEENSSHFRANPGMDVEIKICVFAYPPLESVKLARKNTLLGADNYKANFKYIRPDEAMTIVTVKIKAPEVHLGEFEVYTMQNIIGRSKFTFNLVPYQKPSCPESLEVTSVGSTFITLSWPPDSDGGMPQTFTLSTVNDKGKVIGKHNSKDNGQTVMFQNVTDVEPLFSYSFMLNVRNEKGVTKCPHLIVNASTLAEPASAESDKVITAGVAIGVVIVVIIILIVAIVLLTLCMRKRKKTQQENEQVYSESKEKSSNQHETSKGIDNTDMNSKLQHHSYDQPEKITLSQKESVYRNDSAMKTKQATIQNQDSENTSDKEKPKSPKPQPSPRKSRAQGDMYANSLQTEKAKSDTETKETGLFLKKSQTGKKKKQAPKEPLAKQVPTSGNEVVQKEPNKELVYIEVEIVPKKEAVPSKRIVIEESREEPVAYASVNFNASVNDAATDGTDETIHTVL
ncbi:nephrin [Elysia marginata]|uniref:Nephrin n=1 Tax=Elysia marginata TaxID=1093978 RepID=A0AAV4FLH3_9GAST|nr:nephrin [Elysia marginata]